MGMKCGVGDHPLVDGVLVTNQQHIHFIRKVVVDFRHQTEICRECKVAMEFMYVKKMQKAKLMKKAQASRMNDFTSISSVSSDRDSTSVSDRNNNSIDSAQNNISDDPQRNTNALERNVRNAPEGVNNIAPEQNTNTVHKAISSIAAERSIRRDTIDRLVEKTPRHSQKDDTILQENRRERSKTNTTPQPMQRKSALKTPELAAAVSSRKTVSFALTKQAPNTQLNLNHNDVYTFSPTVYDSEDENIQSHKDTAGEQLNVSTHTKEGSDVNEDDVDYFQRTLGERQQVQQLTTNPTDTNVRLSQEPSTSAAAAARPNVPQTPVTANVPKVRKKISDYMKVIVPPSKAATASPIRKRTFAQLTADNRNVNGADTDLDDDEEPRLSQEPSTSKAAAVTANVSQFPVRRNEAKVRRKLPEYMKTTAPTSKATTSIATAIASSDRSLSQKSIDSSNTEDIDTEDEDGPRLSLNAFTARLPNVQPILPKGRQFHHPDKRVMDIYAQGLHGG